MCTPLWWTLYHGTQKHICRHIECWTHCISISISIYIFLYIYMYIHIYIYMYKCIHICMFINICACMHTYINMHPKGSILTCMLCACVYVKNYLDRRHVTTFIRPVRGGQMLLPTCIEMIYNRAHPSKYSLTLIRVLCCFAWILHWFPTDFQKL